MKEKNKLDFIKIETLHSEKGSHRWGEYKCKSMGYNSHWLNPMAKIQITDTTKC